MKVILAAVVGVMLLLPHAAMATPILIDFEGFSPLGVVTNVNPGSPYIEDGFTFTPTTGASAVVDAAAAFDMPGDATDFFAFDTGNTVTLTGPTPFSLDSLLLGPYDPSLSTNITLVGALVGGGTLTHTFTALTTSTLGALNWSNLTSVQFTSTAAAGIDDLSINATATAVPEPASLLLLGSGIAGVAAKVRKRRKQHIR